ncbi:hypothetical protein CEXT_547161 [Caerostris extrusa]|uniref:Uncharacterized protein n=1 Tax=Caerostris extrusa TaxID=172846 RepID=A0AAV4UBJ9_CAEEX|nr:hypothetical protein CEXT_547161 [Caerostris extrusa]
MPYSIAAGEALTAAAFRDSNAVTVFLKGKLNFPRNFLAVTLSTTLMTYYILVMRQSLELFVIATEKQATLEKEVTAAKCLVDACPSWLLPSLLLLRKD